MKKLICSLLFLSSTLPLAAQERTVVVQGRVTDAESKKGLEGAGVRQAGADKAASALREGYYLLTIRLKKSALLEFSMVGYGSLSRQVVAAAEKDTVILNVQLTRKPVELPEISVSSKQKVDTVIGNWRFYIEDYEFYNGKYILLTWEKNLSRSKVMLADEKQRILSAFPVPGEAQHLYKDFQGNVNVICKDAVYRVKVLAGDKLGLASLPPDQFTERIVPCVDTIGENLYFSTYRSDYPRFDYYVYNRKMDTVNKVAHIEDTELQRMYNFEYEFLKPADKVMARKLARDLHMDKKDVAAIMTGFANSYYFTPLYAPMFVIRDTVCVFDHYRSTLFKFANSSKLIDSIPFDYHKPRNWREWKRELIKDQDNGNVFALFQKDGFTYLKHIDLRTGKVNGTYRLTYQYVDRIRIKGGEVYYIYRPFDSLQKKFLYKERLGGL